MPATRIDCTVGREALNTAKYEAKPTSSCVISSSMGLLLLDIQGELNLPSKDETSDKHDMAIIDQIHDAVKFGRLIFDDASLQRVTLFIGNSQRLLGKIEDLPKPVGVLRVSTTAESASDDVKLIDVVHKKLTFNQRPLPIM